MALYECQDYRPVQSTLLPFLIPFLVQKLKLLKKRKVHASVVPV